MDEELGPPNKKPQNSFVVPYEGADELAVHAILQGYHKPKIDRAKIRDMFIIDAYSGRVGLLDEGEVEVSLNMIEKLVGDALKKGINM